MIKQVLAAVFLAVGVLTASAIEPLKLNEIVYGNTVFLENGCSGVVVDKEKKYILSAGHCADTLVTSTSDPKVDKLGTLRVSFRSLDASGNVISERTAVAQLVKVNFPTDLSLWQIVDPYFPLNTQADLGDFPKLGDTVWCAGTPWADEGSVNTVTKGIVGNLSVDWSGRNYRIHGNYPLWIKPLLGYDCATVPGDSGSGVYSDDGKLIAIHVAGQRDSTTGSAVTGFAKGVRITEIREFLR